MTFYSTQALDDVLNRCEKANITISRKKVNLTTSENNYQKPFAGFMVGREGCSPDPKKVEAIAKMEPPGDVSSLRSFLGLCNTFSHWLPDLSQTAKPLRELLKKGPAYTWLDTSLYRQGSPDIDIDFFVPWCQYRLVEIDL